MSDSGPALKRIILETGSGNALHSGDYTKAAERAVFDALHNSSLTLFRSMGIDPNSMQIEVIIAAQEPEKVDLVPVAKVLPYGEVTARAVKGGLNVTDSTDGRACIIVNAAVIVRLPL